MTNVSEEGASRAGRLDCLGGSQPDSVPEYRDDTKVPRSSPLYPPTEIMENHLLPSEVTQFKEGVSGNPVGRPKGSKNKITLLRQSLELQLREASADRMHAVLDKAFELALQGDRTMLKLLLELHMAKGIAENEKATEKVEINITTQPAEKPVLPALSGTYEDVTDVG